MRVIRVLPALVLLGCASDASFKIKDQSCGEDFTDWYPDLTYHILQGAKDGQFSYDPDGPALSQLDGDYDLSSGDFSWSESFDDEHYLVSKTISGFGYANVNGDLDIVATETYTDVADQNWEVQHRVERTGCVMEQRRFYDDSDGGFETVEEGNFDSGEYRYTKETDRGSYVEQEEGTLSSELTLNASVSIATDGYMYESTVETNLPTGEGTVAFYQESDSNGQTVEYEGTTDRFMNGSRAVNYEVRRPGETTGVWDYEIDYFGTGSGTYKAGSMTCEIEFDRGDCYYDCGGGNTGSC